MLLTLSIFIVITTFSKSAAFYGTEYDFDIIYSSDSPYLVKTDSYISLYNSQNDIRQPLFAIFAMPFVGISYLLINLFHLSSPASAILLNLPQICMLFAANLMLTRILELSTIKRVCFMLISCSSYTYLLSLLMMEQYITAYFWLILCILAITQGNRPQLALWSAGGTLLTSLALLPFISDKSPRTQFSQWLRDILKCAFGFIAAMLCFGRADVLYTSFKSLSSLRAFMGEELSFGEKISQYTSFIRNLFLAPSAGISNASESYVTWQLNAPAGLNHIGVILLILVVVSAVVNRFKNSSRLAAAWVAFSFVILVLFGWGTAENGLILYSLYFGWAYMVLLFQFAEKIERALKVPFLIPLLSITGVVILAAVNIPAMMEMLDFAIRYYPA